MPQALHMTGLTIKRDMKQSGGYRRWDFYRLAERREKNKVDAANKKRWLAISRSNTLGDKGARVCSIGQVGTRSFRLVDRHGRAFGRRYWTAESARDPSRESQSQMPVIDAHGNTSALPRSAKCRIVRAQPEDLMSQASRILKAEFKRSKL